MTDKVVEFPKKAETDPVDEAVAGLLGWLADQPKGSIRGIAVSAIVRGEDGHVARASMYTESCDNPDMLTFEAGLLARRLEQTIMEADDSGF